MGLEQKSHLPPFSLRRKIGSVRERSWSIFLPYPDLDREGLGCANSRGLHIVWALGAGQDAGRVGSVYGSVRIGNLHLIAMARSRGS